MARSTDIVGYAFNADVYCPDHIVGALTPQGSNRASQLHVEQELNMLAEAAGIDRFDERSFDSGDFPKVIFRDSADDQAFQGYPETCAVCGCEIAETF